MAKKKKNKEQLPEGMSRRQAKLAARAKERAALDLDRFRAPLSPAEIARRVQPELDQYCPVSPGLGR